MLWFYTEGFEGWYPKRRRDKSFAYKRKDNNFYLFEAIIPCIPCFAYKRKDNNSYPKFSVLSEGGIKASHTKKKIITLIPSFKIKDFNKPSS